MNFSKFASSLPEASLIKVDVEFESGKIIRASGRKARERKTLFCFLFCSHLIMPQTVSPVDPIPSPPSAKIPAGGTLCVWRGHTCASLAHRYGASLPARQTQRQAARLPVERSTCPGHLEGRDRDSRLREMTVPAHCSPLRSRYQAAGLNTPAPPLTVMWQIPGDTSIPSHLAPEKEGISSSGRMLEKAPGVCAQNRAEGSQGFNHSR